MRVLKKGREQKGWSKEFVCTGVGNGGGGCGAKLLVSQDDIYKTYHHCYDSNSDSFNTFTCANCGVETDIKESLPFTVPDKKQWETKMHENSHEPLFLTVDIAVRVNGKVLLIKRRKEPFTDKLVMPGGHVEKNENIISAAVRELAEETGLCVKESQLQFLCWLDQPTRDPRSRRRISIVYRVDLLNENILGSCYAGSDAKEIVLKELRSLMPDEIGFDHWEAIKLLNRRY